MIKLNIDRIKYHLIYYMYFQYFIQLFVHSATDLTGKFAWIEGADIDENALRNNGTMATGCYDNNLLSDFLRFRRVATNQID